MRALILRIILILITSGKLRAQENQHTFHNLNEKDGLVENLVFCLLKDSRGILWVGTQNGLSRFDGSHFYNFKRTRDKNSLPHNAIECLSEDSNGNIWGGTDNGIFRYSPSINKFDIFQSPSNAVDNVIHNITCDKTGAIYATTTFSLIKLDAHKQSFVKVALLDMDSNSTNLTRIGKNRMVYDEVNQGLWLATSRGLLYYDLTKSTFTGSHNAPDDPVFAKHSTSGLTKAPDGTIWFCDNTAQEIITLNPKTKEIIRKIALKNRTIASNAATLKVDRQNRLWLSNWAYNILCIDLNNHDSILHLYSKDGDRTSISGQFLWAVLEDENGSIWFGTLNGLSVTSTNKQVFKAHRLPEKIPELKNTPLYLVKENPIDKTWWLSTGDGVLIHYDPNNFRYTIYSPLLFKKNSKGLQPLNIFNIHFVNNDVLMTSSNGSWQLKKGAKDFEPCTLLPKEYQDLTIVKFLETDSLYCFSDGFRLLKLNKYTRQSQWLEYDSIDRAQNSNLWFNHLLWKPNQPIYWTCGRSHISTEGKNGQIKIINMIKDTIEEAGGFFQAADMDKDGNIWTINKGVGLYRYHTKSGEVSHWSDLDGLVNNHQHAMITDTKGYVWCTYYNKASVFNPQDNSFNNFSIPYAENKSVYFNNLTLRSDGVVMGNVYNDVFEFYTANLNVSPLQKTPEFSSVRISGKDYFISSKEEIQLQPDQNSIRINFGLLVDASVYPYTFEYKLEGLDENWIASSTAHEAIYNNLAPGDYTFCLIAKGKNKVWQSKEKVFSFHIKTPFYKSSWFLSILVLVFTTGLFLFYRYRLKQREMLLQLESKAQLLEKEKSIVMYESLKQQLNPHFLFNSLTSLSGLIETDQAQAGEFLEQMSGIYRYILKNGHSETVYLKDELKFMQLYVQLQMTRFSKGLKVETNIPSEYLNYKIAPVTLQNLLENAMKHNIIDEDTPLRIEVYIDDNYVVVKNNLQRKNKVETSNKKGLEQFVTLYKYLSERPIVIEENESIFQVKIPLI